MSALRAAFAESLSRGVHDDQLGPVLSQAAAEARSNGMQPEQLLVTLKDLWFSLPELTANTGSDVENVLLQELISRCIKEYYADPGTAG
jgi:hypothetical protein